MVIFYGNAEQSRNIEVRVQYSIPTIGPNQKYYREIRISKYTTLSISYVNDNIYLRNELHLLDIYIRELKNTLQSSDGAVVNHANKYYLVKIRLRCKQVTHLLNL